MFPPTPNGWPLTKTTIVTLKLKKLIAYNYIHVQNYKSQSVANHLGHSVGPRLVNNSIRHGKTAVIQSQPLV